MQIDRSRQSPNFSSRDGTPIVLILLHATVGSYASAISWLCNPQPNAPKKRVSSHYVIRQSDGHIAQLVDEANCAWHAGESDWPNVPIVDDSVNACSISIELENDNDGRDPYSAAQLAALVELVTDIRTRHKLPITNIVRHFDVCIPRDRKTDPAGFPMQDFRVQLVAGLTQHYTAGSLILGSTPTMLASVIARFPASPHYTTYDIERVILPAYWRQAEDVGINPVIAIAQMAHETGALSSWWCDRPRRNPAGIGVTGRSASEEMHAAYPERYPDTAWARGPDGAWWAGVSFATWADHAIPAHLGRLLAYALTDTQATEKQRSWIDYALSYRPLPASIRGSAQTLKQLGKAHNPSGQGWAAPGDNYGAKLAEWANRLAGAG